MESSVDKAILEALGLDASNTTLSSHGSSGFSSTYELSTTYNTQPQTYFVKIGSGPDAERMFKGEYASLNAIHDAIPNFCPKAYAYGPLQTAKKYFLVTDFVDFKSSSIPDGSGMTLAAKLARLHTTAAPIPEGFTDPMFGFPVATCCGETVQDNSWKSSWADFYAENRLRSILRSAVNNNGSDTALSKAVEATVTKVVPRLIGDANVQCIQPVIIHGDLWSGNHSRGQMGGKGGTEEVVFDPSAVYGHSEYELGMMRMFGGFGTNFWKEYETLIPKMEPKEEFEDRLALYEL